MIFFPTTHLTVRKAFFFALLFFVLFPVSMGQSQEHKKITVITSQDSNVYQKSLKGLQDHFKDRKENVHLEIKNIEEHAVLEDIRVTKPDLIVTMGSTITQQITQNINDIPIVFSSALLADKREIKGKNVTGVTLNIPIKEQFKLMKQIHSSMKTIGVLYNPEVNDRIISQGIVSAQELGLELSALKVKEYRQVVPQLKSWFSTIDFLWIIADNKVCQPTNLKHLILQALKAGLPTMGISKGFLNVGALIAITADYEDIGRQSGEVVSSILAGKLPEQIDMVEPRKIDIYLNLTIAKQLALTIPDSVLNNAIEVIGK